MATREYENMRDQIKKMPDWKATALCAACAEKVAPIVALMGLPSTHRLNQKCIEHVWASLVHPPESQEAIKLARALETTPEWSCVDNHYLPWLVLSALDFTRFALSAAASDSPTDQAVLAMSTLPEVAQSYDMSIEEFPGHDTLRVELEKHERSSRIALIDVLNREDHPSTELIGHLLQEAKVSSELFKRALPIHVYDYLRSSAERVEAKEEEP